MTSSVVFKLNIRVDMTELQPCCMQARLSWPCTLTPAAEGLPHNAVEQCTGLLSIRTRYFKINSQQLVYKPHCAQNTTVPMFPYCTGAASAMANASAADHHPAQGRWLTSTAPTPRPQSLSMPPSHPRSRQAPQSQALSTPVLYADAARLLSPDGAGVYISP